MESILLCGLALVGFNILNTEEPLKINKKQKLDDSYETNISDEINKIEKNQANNLKNSIIEKKPNNFKPFNELTVNMNKIEKKPEFFEQFDELTFNNMGDPTPITESHVTITGVNHSLQRGLDLTNGYSNINESLNYNIISNENFNHNNMTPNTSKRDYTPDSEHSSRKLEAFTGVSDYWVPKQEKNHLFEPMKDLTYVNGMPVMTDYLDDRYLASNKNNMGNLPFQTNIKIRPGLEGENREGLGTVYRIAPRNVDELRSENKQKLSYKNKPLETIKKGEYRAPDYNLTKHKMPDFRENNFEDLVAGRSQMEGMRKNGKYTDINTQRGYSDINYTGVAYASTMGEGPSKNKTKFESPKKQEFYNDPTHSVGGVNIKPVMQNKGSYINRETQRASLPAAEIGAACDINNGSYTVDPNFIPLTTLRQLMINGDTNIGITGPQQKANYIFSNEMVLPSTIRETTTHNIVLGAKGENNIGSTQNIDNAKTTIKETTLAYKGGFANPIDKTGANQFSDSAKTTTKETTLAYKGGFTNPIDKTGANQFSDSAKTTTKETTLAYKGGFTNPIDKIGANQFSDSAKITIKQTTLYTTPGKNVGGIILNSYTKDHKDIAKHTNRQTTENNTYEGTITCIEQHKSYSKDEKDTAKITIRQNTLSATPGVNVKHIESQLGYSRDKNDIAKKTIKQTTENNNYQGPSYMSNYSGYIKDDNDIAKKTIKQTTENNNYQGHIHGSDNYSGYIKDNNDIAKTTIRETTHLQNYTGGLQGNENQTCHMAADNISIDERREITTYNRTSGGGTNLGGPQINKDKIKMNTKKSSIFYVTAPSKPLDQSVMPSRTEPYNNSTFENKKPQLTYGDYRTNNIFINTLKNNPLVNDIYHQKNV